MLEKLMVGHLAAQMTSAVMAGMDQPADVMQRQVNACQVFTNFYEWFKNILVDQNWPTPQIDGSWLARSLGGVVQTTPATGGTTGTTTTTTPVPPTGTVATPTTLPGVATATTAAKHMKSKDKDLLEIAEFQEELMKISPTCPHYVPKKMPTPKP